MKNYVGDEENEISTNERSKRTLNGILNQIKEKLPPKVTFDGLESRQDVINTKYQKKTQAQQKEEYLLKKGKGGSDKKETRF